MQNIVFLLCEGPHDVAFLVRILKTIGFKNYSKKIREYPEPINQYISKSLKDIAIEEMNLEELRSRPIPSDALEYENNTLFLLYSMHGDSKRSLRKGIIREILDFIPQDPDALNPLEDSDITLSILYFFDADDRGVALRLQEIKTELTDFLNQPISDDYFRANACFHDIKNVRYGAYIISKHGENVGKLEDILVPLMKEGNEEIFTRADEFLELKDDSRLYKLKVQKGNGKIVERRTNSRMKFDMQKSEICVAGQLQNSGKSNVVIIKDCDYVTLDKIRESRECQEILNFFGRILS
ncbi:MAG: hypothetical protein GY795_16470 [Desulfobacterales bacterium]|nr:hypothetical protein [Desulfobacterales bacterium]